MPSPIVALNIKSVTGTLATSISSWPFPLPPGLVQGFIILYLDHCSMVTICLWLDFFFFTCFTMHTCSYGLAKMVDYHSISLIKIQTPFHSSTNPRDLVHTCFSLLSVSFLPSSSNNTLNEYLWGSRICDMAGYAIRNKIRYCLYHPRANILLEQPEK